jgi:hypothetical protein
LPFQRYFGEVKLRELSFYPSSKLLTPLIDNLEAIGSKIIKLEIEKSTAYKNGLLDVLRLASDVQELRISSVKIAQQSTRNQNQKLLVLPHLRLLELRYIKNFGSINGDFDQIKSLEHLQLRSIEKDWKH